MKKFCLLLAFFLAPWLSFAQCPTASVVLTTQAQVNNFKINYPSCTVFDYSIRVSGTGITNLNGLSNLTKVASITVENTSLVNLTGLNSLIETGYVALEENALMTSVDGLNSLTKISSSFGIHLCLVLTDISALSNLTKLKELGLSNTAVTSLHGLENIDSLSSLGLQACEYLTDVDALDGVKFKPELISSLVLLGNPVLSDCVGEFICTAASEITGSQPLIIASNAAGCNTLTEIKDNCLAALPVTLIGFEAKKTDHHSITLSWATTSETKSKKFDIHRSDDGRSWVRIGTVGAQGESANTVRYTFEDASPNAGVSFYRLKMVDMDDTFTYSQIISTSFKGAKSAGAYPNPVADRLHLGADDLTDLLRVQIVNTTGQTVLTSTRVESDGIDVKGLAMGMYVVNIKKKGGKAVQYKVFKNK